MTVCEVAILWTADYTRERKGFGKAFLDMQHIRFRLAVVMDLHD